MDNNSKDFVLKFRAKDEGVISFMDRTIQKSEALEKQLKAVGKATGSAGLGQIGEAFGNTGKLGSFIGKGGLALGGLAIAGQVGKEMQQMAGGIDRATEAMDKFDGNYGRVAGELARSIPFLGDAVKGFDAMGESLGNFAAAAAEKSTIISTALGWTNSLRGAIGMKKIKFNESEADIAAEAAQVEARRLESKRLRDATLGIISGSAYAGPLDATGKIRAQAEGELKTVTQARWMGVISSEDFANSQAAILKHRDDELAKIAREGAEKRIQIARKENEDVLKIQRETGRIQRDMAISEKESRGDTVGASIDRSRAKLNDDIFDIGRQISARLVESVSLNLRDPKIGALLGQAGTITNIQGMEEKRIQADAIKAIDDRTRAINSDIAATRAAQRIGSMDRPSSSWLDEARDDPKAIDGRGQMGYFRGLMQRNSEKWTAYAGNQDAAMRTAKATETQNTLTERLIGLMEKLPFNNVGAGISL